MLETHDWYYYFSDDARVNRIGERADKDLELLSYLSKDHRAIYAQYKNHMFSGVVFGKPQVAKPRIPEEVA